MSTRHSIPASARRVLVAALALSLPCTQAWAQFAPPANVNVGVGVAPATLTGIASGDLDGDGFGDVLAVDDVIGGAIGVARGQAGGTFGAPQLSGPLPATTGGTFLPALGDFDLDGFLDVALAADVAAVPTVLLAMGNPAQAGTFTLPPTAAGLGGGGAISALRITDTNSDGDQDVVCAVIGPNRRIATLPGTGGSTFGPLISSTTSVGPADIDICVDLGDDQDKDIVVCGLMTGGQPAFQVMLGNDTGAFFPQSPVPLPANADPIDIHWFDCNQDHAYDLVIASQGSAKGIFRALNTGAAPFFSSLVGTIPFPVTNVPNSLLRLEANFDGVEDLSVFSLVSTAATVAATDFEILHSVGCGFVPAGVTSSGAVFQNVLQKTAFGFHAVADADFDGREDVLIGDQSATNGRVLLFRNTAGTDFTVSPSEPLLGESTPFTFRLTTPLGLGGSPFLVLFSVAGTVPGIPVQGQLLPLMPPFLPIVMNGVVGATNPTTIVTPPLAIAPTPVGFSLQIACAALVRSTSNPSKIAYISRPAVITMP